jgi:hypothetical protein
MRSAGADDEWSERRRQMDSGTLGAALEREHREIDRGIEAFGAGDDGAIASLTAAIGPQPRHQ